ncbi:S41 family peptidase [bacterium]|nr:S41 family peptidase [bacterium]
MAEDAKKSLQTTLPQHLPFLTLLLLLLLGFYALHGPVRSYLSGRYRAVALFDEALGIVLEEYVEPRTPLELSQGAIDGMVDSLADRHSMFLKPRLNKHVAEDETGRYVGLGILIELVKRKVVIRRVFPGTPAAAAGLKMGDILLSVAEYDPKNIQPETVTDITDMAKIQDVSGVLEGKPGTYVRLGVFRGGKKLSIMVQRREIIRLVVEVEMAAPGIGYLRLTDFPDNVQERVAAGLAELREKGMRALIFDMQNNGGGFLDEAVAVADLFVSEGIIVSTRSRHERDNRIYKAKPGDLAEAIPVVILVDGGTASAAEVVAGALQDHKRAHLVGVSTYGKGAVNKRFALDDASGMLITTGRYYLPSGRQIEGRGLTPDTPIDPALLQGAEDPSAPKGVPPPSYADLCRAAAVKLLQRRLGAKNPAPGESQAPNPKP